MIGVPDDRAPAAGVRDRERAALDVVRDELLRAGAFREVGDRASRAEQVQALRVPDHRHDQALAALERDGDAEVHELLAHDRVAADLAVHPRPVLDRRDRRARDEGEVREVDAVALLILGLQPLADVHDLRQVDLEHGRHVRRSVERAAHVLGDAAAHGAHRLDDLAGLGGDGWRGGRCRSWRRRGGRLPEREPVRPARGGGGPALEVREDVLLRHAPAAAGAGDRVGVDAVLGCDSRHDRRDEGLAVPGRLRRLRLDGPGRGLRLRRSGAGLRLGHRLLVLMSTGLGLRNRHGRRRRCGDRAFGGDRREQRPHLDRLALGDEDLLDDAAARARDLRVDLVGRDLEQRLVGGDRLARLLEPLRDRPLRDGNAHLGHDDFDRGSRGHLDS